MNSLVGLGAVTSFAAGAVSWLKPDGVLDASFLEEPVMLLAFVLLGTCTGVQSPPAGLRFARGDLHAASESQLSQHVHACCRLLVAVQQDQHAAAADGCRAAWTWPLNSA